MQEPRPHYRPVRFFFMHLGTLLGFILYVVLGERSGWSAPGLTHALRTALGVHTVYMLLAAAVGELKQFDVALWLLFAIGIVADVAGLTSVLALYRHYAGTLLFTTFALTAFSMVLLGRETFTVYHAKRQTPRWQWRTPAFHQINRVMALYWGSIFVVAALLCASRPADPMFTLVYPNLLIFIVGVWLGRYVPDLWMRRFPAPLPDVAGPLIMGMPFVFDAGAAGDARAVIQFRVSGDEPGDYWLRVQGGQCESFEGMASAADLTVHTPGDVWVGIVHGRLDGAAALMQSRYRVEGDPTMLAKLSEWFRAGS